MPAFSPQYDAALVFAACAHRKQLRKGTKVPYIAHPVHVSVLLIRHGFPEDLAAAALLHDVVEDCDVSLQEIEKEFGPRIARLVDAVTERKIVHGAKVPWEERKAASLEHLRGAGRDAAALKAADALHNVRALVADIGKHGPGVWARFKRGPEQSLRYYREVLGVARAGLGEHPLASELAAAIDDLERAPRP
jgi:(p)ppGpp synthase/HD superfamily hydrolase